MTPELFDHLLALVEPLIHKEDTIMRRAVPARHRLMYTLRYLASGANFYLLSELFRVSEELIANDIPKVGKSCIFVKEMSRKEKKCCYRYVMLFGLC